MVPLLLATGCSGLAPQIFSDRVLVNSVADTKRSDPPPTFQDYYDDANLVMRRYVTAVRDDGNAVPLLSAGLIGLTGLTLYKGVTGANTKDIAGAGVLGSTALAFGTTFHSKTRRDVYRAGAEAMSCALAAVEPLRKGQVYLGEPTDSSLDDTLYGRVAAVQEARDALVTLRSTHKGLLEPLPKQVAAYQKCVTVQGKPPGCTDIPANARPSERASLEALCSQPGPARKQCTTVPPHTVQQEPADVTRKVFEQADAEITRSEAQVTQAQRGIEALESAGPLLGQKSLQIQLKVSEEVEKSTPDLASVLASSQGMRAAAFGLTGLDAFKPPGVAQGDPTKRAIDTTSLGELVTATERLHVARVRLVELLNASLGAGYSQVRKTLNECSVRATGVRLNVTPGTDTVSVPAGGTTTFFVSGGTGIPSAVVISGPRPGPLPVRLEGGLFRFDYKAEGLAAGDTAIVRFADGAGQGEHLVEVKITPATPSATGNTTTATAPPSEQADKTPVH